MSMRILTALRLKLQDGAPLFVLIACSYLAISVFGGIWILLEYQASGGAIPISPLKFLLVLFVYGPIAVLAYGLLEAAFEVMFWSIVAAAKRVIRLVRGN